MFAVQPNLDVPPHGPLTLQSVSNFFGRVAMVVVLALMSNVVVEAADPDYEAKILAELRAIDADAAEIFAQATVAREAGDHEKAAQLYQQVVDQHPDFDHGLRRLGMSVLHLGDRDRALELCEKALAIRALPENQAAAASALITPPEGREQPIVGDALRARDLALAASKQSPGESYFYAVLCHIALIRQNTEELLEAASKWRGLEPESYLPLMYLTMAKASLGNFEVARAHLVQAKELGMPVGAYAFLDSTLSAAQANPMLDMLRVGGWIGIVWLAGFPLILLFGWSLSRLTLERVKRMAKAKSAAVEGVDAFLRRVYVFVLWVSCAYFYVSMPILIIVVLGVTGLLIYGFLALGHIPIKLVLIILIVAFFTVISIVRSLFVRGDASDPGKKIDLARNLRFRALLDQVAAKIRTRPVDNVYLTPGAEVAVMERGGMGRQLRGTAERCLILGVGAMNGFTIKPFKAVLAHEYGHFSNRDTAGGGFALAVRRSLMTLAYGLAESGSAAWYNPAWLFVNGFNRVFMRVSQGASRLQEVLADRWATLSYGAEAFVQGLSHVIQRSIRLNVQVAGAAQDTAERKRAVANVYAYQPMTPPPEEDLAKAFEESINAEPSPYDSHPSPKDRFEWARALEVDPIESCPDDAAELWSYFEDREALEVEMTKIVSRSLYARHGIDIVRGETGNAEMVEQVED